MVDQNQAPSEATTPPEPPTQQAQPVQSESPSTNAILALALGIGGFFIFQPIGIIALFIAIKERRAIREGRSPKAGETFALIGFILGIVDTVLTVLGLLAIIFFFLLIALGVLGGASRF